MPMQQAARRLKKGLSAMLNATIQSNSRIASGIHEMALRFDAGVADFQPGQFAHVRLPGEGAMLLRRPVSVNHVDAGAGSFTLVYQVRGGGTRLLSELKQGERLDVLAPLGRGFRRPEGMKRAALVGGGIGAAPLRTLPEAWPDVAFDAYLGFRGEQYAYQIAEFEKASGTVYLCSDDGSLGDRTFVTCLLDESFFEQGYNAVFACGPAPMLRALRDALAGRGVPCQVSLEERMACGYGACLVCSCKILGADGWHHQRVCRDGPVFDLTEVVFDGQA